MRLATALAALTLALPGHAIAQGAGDGQDPFADEQTTQNGGGLTERPPGSDGGGSGDGDGGGSGDGDGGGSGGGSASGDGSGTGDGGKGASGPTGGGSAGTSPSATGTGALPNTGTDPRVIALAGVALLLGGLGLRLRTIDPDVF